MGPIEQSMRERVVAAKKRMASAATKPAVPASVPAVPAALPSPPPRKETPPIEASLRKLIVGPKVNKTVIEVCERHGVNPLLVASENRERPVVAARNEIFSILNAGGFSLARIGKIFGKDHTSVRYSVMRHRGLPIKSRGKAGGYVE